MTRYQARKHLTERGWSQRRAAKVLEVTQKHLCLVLTGKRKSGPLLARIANLPFCPQIPPNSPYANGKKNGGKTQGRKGDPR
jgi:hypothetical protein